MMKVTSKVKLNFPTIKRVTRAQVSALEQTAEALHTEVVQAQVVPRDTGNLQNEAFFVDYSESSSGKVTLVHSTPYARRLYFHPEYQFHRSPWTDEKGKRHEGNLNAKGEWFEDWEAGGKYADFATETYKAILRRLLP